MGQSLSIHYDVAAASVAALSWRAAGYAIRQYFVKTMTVMNDIPNLGIATSDENRIKGTAVICGGR